MTEKEKNSIIETLVDGKNLEIFNGEMFFYKRGKWIPVTNDVVDEKGGNIHFYDGILKKIPSSGYNSNSINLIRKSVYGMIPHRALVSSPVIYTPSYKIDLINGTSEHLSRGAKRKLKLSIAVDPELDPSKKVEWWDKMLSDALNGEKDAIQAYYEMIGMSMTTDRRFELSYWLTGKAGTGKSTIANAVLRAIHEQRSVSSIEPSEWKTSSPTFYKLANKLVNISSDNAHERSLETGVFKRLVSGETIVANVKYQAPIEFHSTALLVSIGNSMPIINETTDGPFRRMIMLNFDKVIDKSSKNINIKHEIANNKDGVLNYIVTKAIVAVVKVYKSGEYTNPQSSRESLDGVKSMHNSALTYWNEEYNGRIHRVVDRALNNSGAAWADIYADYKEWCQTGSERTWGRNKFIQYSTELMKDNELFKSWYYTEKYANKKLVFLKEENQREHKDDGGEEEWLQSIHSLLFK